MLAPLAGCKAKYPACESDKDCQAKEYCVDRKCQQCRTTGDCPAGKECASGKCANPAGYCTDRSECAVGQECIENRCRACQSDTECPSGLKCAEGKCQQCAIDNDCPQDKECQEGACVGRPKVEDASCTLRPVYFGFDESSLSTEATETLNGNSSCLSQVADRPIDLVGHADSRGTTEYNLALSDRRAQATSDYLRRLGTANKRLIKVPRGELDSSGEDDAGWAKDRRVDSKWR
jgi:peptidoglycan-associated lipoprotein